MSRGRIAWTSSGVLVVVILAAAVAVTSFAAEDTEEPDVVLPTVDPDMTFLLSWMLEAIPLERYGDTTEAVKMSCRWLRNGHPVE